MKFKNLNFWYKLTLHKFIENMEVSAEVLADSFVSKKDIYKRLKFDCKP